MKQSSGKTCKVKCFLRENCSLKNTLLSLCLSAAFSLGILCFFRAYAYDIFNEVSIHPIEYPASVICGLLAMILCVVVAVIYIISNRKNFKIKGVLFDIAAFLITVPVFFGVIGFLINLLCK